MPSPSADSVLLPMAGHAAEAQCFADTRGDPRGRGGALSLSTSGPALVAIALAVILGCSRRPPFTQQRAKEALEVHAQLRTGSPEVPVAPPGRCHYFSDDGSKISFGRSACTELKLGLDSSGNLTAVLPQTIQRRILSVAPPSAAAASEPSTTFEWEWASEELPEAISKCFRWEPRQALATFAVQDGKWVVKDVMIERLITQPYQCPF